ncbi:MAG: alpha/beta fold hydrolase [Anaerolineales bacterium]
MSAVVIDNKVVHYEVLGRGPPIVFLHGWVGSWRYWVPTMQAISVRYRTYAIDLWGFGDTSNVADRYSLDAQVQLVESFLEQLGVARVALVGHALGGLIGLRFAARHPDLTARVMAINTPLTAAAVNQRFRSTAVDGLVEWLVDRGPDGAAIATESTKTDPPAIAATLTDLESADVQAELAAIKAPALLVYGEKDPAIAAVEQVGADAAKLHNISFEESRHFPMLDATPQFNRLLLDFLEAGEDLDSLSLKDEWKRRMR